DQRWHSLGLLPAAANRRPVAQSRMCGCAELLEDSPQTFLHDVAPLVTPRRSKRGTCGSWNTGTLTTTVAAHRTRSDSGCGQGKREAVGSTEHGDRLRRLRARFPASIAGGEPGMAAAGTWRSSMRTRRGDQVLA